MNRGRKKETNSLKTLKIFLFGLGFDLIAVWDIWDHCQHFDRSLCP